MPHFFVCASLVFFTTSKTLENRFLSYDNEYDDTDDPSSFNY